MSEPYKNLAWDDFRLVKAVAEARSLPGAAAAIGVNHSTVFRRLGQIETALGQSLFERHRSGYVPTPAGEEMSAVAARLEHDITAFTRRAAGQELSPSGELRVTTTDTLLVHVLSPLLVGFQARCPDVRLDIVVANQALNLSRRDADVAIRASARPPETLIGRKVAAIGWALYGRRPADPLAPPPDPDNPDVRWVSFGEAFVGLEAARALAGGVPPSRVVYRLNTTLGLAEAIEGGAGIGFLPCFVGDGRPGLLRLQAGPPAFSHDLWLLTHPDLRAQPRVRVFLDFMARAFAPLRERLAGRPDPAGDPDRQ